jgi:multicomponent Na+:H+ antiporter subunit B
MRSPILEASARPILWTAVALSLWLLLRGHNAPGGGFIAGLIAASGIVVLALSAGPAVARRALRLPPMVIAATGLAASFGSGVPAMATGAPLLTHRWVAIDIGPTRLDLGTTLIFDLGVYLVVVGMAAAVILPFLERK